MRSSVFCPGVSKRRRLAGAPLGHRKRAISGVEVYVSAISGISSLAGSLSRIGGVSVEPGKGGFKDIMTSVLNGLSGKEGVNGLHVEVSKARERILNGQRLGMADLLRYQICAGELALRVEMLAKAADSLISASKRLQNGQ